MALVLHFRQGRLAAMVPETTAHAREAATAADLTAVPADWSRDLGSLAPSPGRKFLPRFPPLTRRHGVAAATGRRPASRCRFRSDAIERRPSRAWEEPGERTNG
jgi:hypothetical protein